MEENWICRMTFINIGNGDSILIEIKDENYKNGHFVMLIDGGSNEPQEYEYTESGRIRAVDFMEKNGVDHVDVMVNTHIHEDHTCGLLPVAKRWTPKELWTPFPKELELIMKPIDVELEKDESSKKFIAALQSYKELCEYVQNQGGKLVHIRKCDGWVPLAKNIKFEVLGSDDNVLQAQMNRFKELYKNSTYEKLAELDKYMNNVSLCMAMECKGKLFLLPGDTDEEGYSKVVKADVYKVGHHGQANSMNAELVKKIEPKNAIICASSDRRYNSASREVLELLDKAGTSIYFTDCPQVYPYTEGVQPHKGVRVLLMENSNLKIKYI